MLDVIAELKVCTYVKMSFRKKFMDVFNKFSFTPAQQTTYDKALELLQVGYVTDEKLDTIVHLVKSLAGLEMKENDIDGLIITGNEIVSPQIATENTEKLLDSEVKKYSRFSETNPMDGVRYDVSKKIYKISVNNQKSSSKFLEKACKTAIDRTVDANTNGTVNIVHQFCDHFEYKKRQFVVYATKDTVYFDIQHIINTLQLTDAMRNIKYNEFSKDIVGYNIFQNDYGGYCIREYITEQTAYEIILSSRSVLSKSFKKDVSKILADVRKSGLLTLSTTGNLEAIPIEQVVEKVVDQAMGQVAKQKRRIKDIAGSNVENALEIFGLSSVDISCVYLFTIGTVEELRNIMAIDNTFDDDCYVVKYGRTTDLAQRTLQHRKTFGEITNSDIKLKYYAWLDEEYISKAETDIKNKLKSMNTCFKYDDMTELGIVNIEQLKDIGDFYDKLAKVYGGNIKAIISKYEMDALKMKYDIERMHEIIGYKDQLLQMGRDNMQTERGYFDRLLKAEQEKTELITKERKHSKH